MSVSRFSVFTSLTICPNIVANREQSAVKDDAQSTAAGGQLLVRVPIDDLKQEVERES